MPVPIVDLALRGLDLDGARTHVQQQVQTTLQEFHGKVVHLVVPLAAGVPPVLGLALGKEDQAVGLGRAEVEGDGSHTLGVPLGQAEVGLGRLKGDGVQDGHVLALEHHVALHLHLGVHDASQTRQLQADVVVLIHHLTPEWKQRELTHISVNDLFHRAAGYELHA